MKSHQYSHTNLPSQPSVRQREVRARLDALADEIAPRHGMTRRRFLRTSAGMAAVFVAMNEVYGWTFNASRTEAKTPEMAEARAAVLKDQFIIDTYTYFMRDDLSPPQRAQLPGDDAKEVQFPGYRQRSFSTVKQ